jgi:uncharacterized membrane protein
MLTSMMVIQVESLVDNATIGNSTVPFPSSIEADASRYWRGIPIRTADIGAVFGGLPSGLAGVSMLVKYDNVTGVLYEIFVHASLDLGGISLEMSLDVSMVQANPAYITGMRSRYDTSRDVEFIFYDISTAPWIIPTLILTIVIVLLVVVIATSKQRVTGKNVTGKQAMTKKQREREILRKRAEKRTTARTSSKKT